MQSVPASEIKRRGIAALNELLVHGPVEIVQRNRPACIVLGVEEYARLRGGTAAALRPGIWDLLLDPSGGDQPRRDRAALDGEISAERESWDRS